MACICINLLMMVTEFREVITPYPRIDAAVIK